MADWMDQSMAALHQDLQQREQALIDSHAQNILTAHRQYGDAGVQNYVNLYRGHPDYGRASDEQHLAAVAQRLAQLGQGATAQTLLGALQQQNIPQPNTTGIHAAAARAAMDIHATQGDDGVNGEINEYMHNGGDPDYLRRVAMQLHQAGRPDLAAIHMDAADGW